MKWRIYIAVIWCMMVLSSCSPPTQVVEPAEGPSEELSAIDSLMWRQPDSALAQLQRFVVSPEADSLDEFNGHYCQLLISELLYKNYAAQSNREELLQAVAYFDSIMQVPEPVEGPSFERNVFLAARAHYINGAGYYERDSVVEACKEYLKTLEMMEAHFEEKAQKGKKTVFMFYTYNRLLELFSSQFMLDPALTCGEKALACCQSEPSLFEEIPNTCFYIGKQHDMKGEISVAMDYYEMAIERMTVTDSPMYRDIVSMKALCDYQLGLDAEQSLNTIKQTITNEQGESERSARFLIIGSVYSEEGLYDSALRYFELVFQDEVDVNARISAAESMRILYDSLGDTVKANECLRFLTDHKKTEGENKALVSKLEDMFKTYMDQKQEKEAEEARKRSIQKTVESIISFAVVIVLSIIVFAKHRSKKLLKQQQDESEKKLGETKLEHEKEIEKTKKRHEEDLKTERLAYQQRQAILQQSLQQREKQLIALEKAFEQQREEVAQWPKTFDEEPICLHILEVINKQQFKAKVDYKVYKDFALGSEELLILRETVDHYFNGFTSRIRKAYPTLTKSDVDYCCLYLLGLEEADLSALMQRAYTTVCDRSRKLKSIFGIEDSISAFVRNFAKNVKI